MSGPLAGIRVVDCTAMIAGPLATAILADQGADVVKVEPPGHGDLVRAMGVRRGDLSATFATANRNKRSVVIDLKQPRGLELVRALARDADVFVQNFRPGTAERLGVAAATLRADAPRLVYVSLSGFGERGPWARRRVYDPVIQALSGLAAIQADRASGRPRMMRLIVPDKVTALTAAQAITAALLARERTGAGQHVRLSMLDATLAFLWAEGMAPLTFPDAPGDGDGERARLAQDLIFETADGYLTAGAVSDAEWAGLAHAVGRPEWLEDARFATAGGRVAHADARLALMADAFRSTPTAEWLERLEAHDVPCAPVLSRREVLEHPQVRASASVVELEHPGLGRVLQARPPARFEATPADPLRPAPALGEHTDAVLAELGLDPAEIGSLRAAGVVA